MKNKIFILLILWSYFYGFEWSRNNVLKFEFNHSSALDLLGDYENVIVTNGSLSSFTSGGWIYTQPVYAGDEYIFGRAFINLKGNNTKGVRLRIIDYNNNEIIGEKVLTRSDFVFLKDNFRKLIYLSIEFFDTNAEVISFGITRKKIEIIPENKIIIEPVTVFFNEQSLLIKFLLGYPSYITLMIFNKDKLVDTIAKDVLIKNGEVILDYDISKIEQKFLSTGSHWVYIKATTLDGKTQEVTKKFYFVKD
jgi:hypothetical protein